MPKKSFSIFIAYTIKMDKTSWIYSIHYLQGPQDADAEDWMSIQPFLQRCVHEVLTKTWNLQMWKIRDSSQELIVLW